MENEISALILLGCAEKLEHGIPRQRNSFYRLNNTKSVTNSLKGKNFP